MRFLALLELYKQGLVDFEQATPFGELQVSWLGMPTATARTSAPLDVEEYQG